MTHLQELLARLVGGDVKLFTTPCISKELRSLGTSFAATAAAARQQQLHKCAHDPPELPSDCLLSAVAKSNPNHWWIATQDKALQVRTRGAGKTCSLYSAVVSCFCAIAQHIQAPQQRVVDA